MSRSSLIPRPTLLPGLRPLWRDRHHVQLGTDPRQAVVLELPHPAAAKLFDMLDGSHTEPMIIAELARIGLPEDEAREVLAVLTGTGLVVAADTLMPPAVPAERRGRIAREAAALALRFRQRPASPATILHRRHTARVIIAGDGPVAAHLITTLAEAGVGTVGKVTEAGDTAKPVISADRSPTVRADSAFVVQIGRLVDVGRRGARQRPPRLVFGVRDGVAIVGPLIPSDRGPCLRCLDLHRTDRDPAWPQLVAQLETDPGPCAAATLMTAAGFAAAEVLTFIDGGDPTTIGTTVEIDGVAPWRRRTWTPHPACDCTPRTRPAHDQPPHSTPPDQRPQDPPPAQSTARPARDPAAPR
ncbi:hypothetical protein, partial [Allorhizocola rhizosphaerae]|uniref:hypothetical protein n=1 Tax=Allorhizocola rhizosphaerae TaxID=1872709 RepID=UPI000E3B8A24